jgi:hypothetical protein
MSLAPPEAHVQFQVSLLSSFVFFGLFPACEGRTDLWRATRDGREGIGAGPEKRREEKGQRRVGDALMHIQEDSFFLFGKREMGK